MAPPATVPRLPHVLFLPYPFQGHFTPLLNLALKLSTSSFSSHHISSTILTTHHFLFRLLRAAKLTQASSLADFVQYSSTSPFLSFHYRWSQLGYDTDSYVRFVGVPDGFPLHDDRVTLPEDYMLSLDTNLESGVDAFLRKSNCRDGDGDGDHSAITCIISDSFLPWTEDLANGYGIPRVFFWSQSVTVACANYKLASHDLGYEPINETVIRRGQPNSLMVDNLPGLPPMDPYDLPYNAREFEVTKGWVHKHLHEQFSRINEADWVLVNSFDELEGSIVQALKPYIPKMLLVGPLNYDIHNLQGKKGRGNKGNYRSGVFRGSAWEDDRKCMAWLDTKPDSSVLFISFGSVHSLTREATEVICEALMNIVWKDKEKEEEVYCLWAWRCWEREMFPGEFWEEMVEKGGRVLLVKWAPQVEVLSHRAIGGFLSHMGWNSTMESVSMGVPMICCPLVFDQFTNSWCAVQQWKVGVEMHYHKDREEDGGMVRLVGSEVEVAIRRVMVEEGEREELRKKAASLNAAACRSWGVPDGSSWNNLETFARFLLESVRPTGLKPQPGLPSRLGSV